MAEPQTSINYDFPSIHENQELLYESYTSSQDSAIRVEISDVEKSGEYFLTGILRRCNQQVLKPYWRLLLFIGWRPFARDRVLHPSSCKCWNVLYPLLITCLLVFSYAYDILVCVSAPVLESTVYDPQSGSLANATTPFRKNLCHNMFSIVIMPSCLHFLAFLYGFWYIRTQENEQIYALIEQVFLQANSKARGSVTQATVIKSLRFILFCGAVWTFAALGINVLYVRAFGFANVTIATNRNELLTASLLVIDLVGSTIQHLINTAIVVNFTVQCEVIIYYMRIIGTRMQEKSSELRTIMNDILRVKQSISRLNGPIANMTSLSIFYFSLRFIIGLCLLILNDDRRLVVWSYWSTYCLIWFVIMVCPLFQAARVNATCDMYKQEGHEVKVFGYLSSTQVELDSFLLFITSAKLKVKLFCMPIKKSYICGVFIIGLLSLAILLLTKVIKPVDTLFF
ncbi:uncharacterized protein LOC117117656 [Anneissia japonica]|uniref:uncharacterized protein LOC117117656 n=1 Tax=Anneissia japonica TaxID=1529436 RepID=UPI0014257947|nr:uncharacterized protein LOC117117656 [Anneissia japonica]